MPEQRWINATLNLNVFTSLFLCSSNIFLPFFLLISIRRSLSTYVEVFLRTSQNVQQSKNTLLVEQ